jgi:hypothetical protein
MAVPATIFFPFISKANVIIPMIIWGAIYASLLQILDRTSSSSYSTSPIILLEFLFIEIGVWLAYQLASGISHAESIMDVMALSAFPSRTINLDDASMQIKVEITRSRRYHRPLGIIVLQDSPGENFASSEIVSVLKNDLAHRFSFARIGHIVDEHVRQTDMIFRDRFNRFIILCPETASQSTQVLAARLEDSIQKRIGRQVLWAVAAFPDDALSFDDLLDVANAKLVHFVKEREEISLPIVQQVENNN